MAKDMEDFGKLGQAGLDNALKMWGDWAKNWQALTAEMTDYTRRSFEDGSKTFEKLATARSFDQVMEIQTSYAKRCYDEHMAQMTRIGSMYGDLAKESTKPLERFLPQRR